MTQKERAEKKAKEIVNRFLWVDGYTPATSIKEDDEALASILCEELTAAYTENEHYKCERDHYMKEMYRLIDEIRKLRGTI